MGHNKKVKQQKKLVSWFIQLTPEGRLDWFKRAQPKEREEMRKAIRRAGYKMVARKAP